MARHEILRVYDDAIVSFVRRHVANSIEGVDLTEHVHMATTDRPFGFDVPVVVDKDSGKKEIDLARAAQMLVTPRVTVTRLDFQYSMTRNNTNPYRMGPYWDENEDFRVFSRHPRPWDITYQIDFRGRRRNDVQNAMQWWLYNVDPVRVLMVEFCYPWGTQSISTQFSQIVDQTIYEVEEGLRYYQYVIPFVLEAYMFEVFDNPSDLPAYSTNPEAFTTRRRTVKRVDVRFRECGSGAVLDVIPGAFELLEKYVPPVGPNPPCCP